MNGYSRGNDNAWSLFFLHRILFWMNQRGGYCDTVTNTQWKLCEFSLFLSLLLCLWSVDSSSSNRNEEMRQSQRHRQLEKSAQHTPAYSFNIGHIKWKIFDLTQTQIICMGTDGNVLEMLWQPSHHPFQWVRFVSGYELTHPAEVSLQRCEMLWICLCISPSSTCLWNHVTQC